MNSQPCNCRERRRLHRLPLRQRRAVLLAGDLLHLLPRLLDRAVDVAVEDRALQHVDPGARVRIDHVGEMIDPRHIADAERLGGGDDARIGGEIFVVGERGRDGRMLFLASPSSWASSVSSQAMNSLASGTCFEPFGIATTSPPTKAETWPSFTPGRKVTPKFMFGTSFLRSEIRKPPRALNADLAGLEHRR